MWKVTPRCEKSRLHGWGTQSCTVGEPNPARLRNPILHSWGTQSCTVEEPNPARSHPGVKSHTKVWEVTPRCEKSHPCLKVTPRCEKSRLHGWGTQSCTVEEPNPARLMNTILHGWNPILHGWNPIMHGWWQVNDLKKKEEKEKKKKKKKKKKENRLSHRPAVDLSAAYIWVLLKQNFKIWLAKSQV